MLPAWGSGSACIVNPLRGQTPLTLVAWFAASLLVLVVIAVSLRRRNAMRSFAARHGLAYTGTNLPDGLRLGRTPFARRHFAVTDCITGKAGGIPMSVFNLSYTTGKVRICQTVVAFPRQVPGSIAAIPSPPPSSCQLEEAGDWIIAYVPRRRVPAQELLAWCTDLHTHLSELMAETEAGNPGSQGRFFSAS